MYRKLVILSLGCALAASAIVLGATAPDYAYAVAPQQSASDSSGGSDSSTPGQSKSLVCHETGRTFGRILSVTGAARRAHLAHGDSDIDSGTIGGECLPPGYSL